MKETNYTAFTPEEVKKGLHLKLIKHLLEEGAELEDSYNDIHISSDGYCTIIEWIQVSFDSGCYIGSFKFVGDDQVIMTEKIFPDNHTELCYDEDDYKEKLDDFLKENPGWVRTSYGTWTNEIENEKFRKMLEKPNYEESGDSNVILSPEDYQE